MVLLPKVGVAVVVAVPPFCLCFRACVCARVCVRVHGPVHLAVPGHAHARVSTLTCLSAVIVINELEEDMEVDEDEKKVEVKSEWTSAACKDEDIGVVVEEKVEEVEEVEEVKVEGEVVVEEGKEDVDADPPKEMSDKEKRREEKRKKKEEKEAKKARKEERKRRKEAEKEGNGEDGLPVKAEEQVPRALACATLFLCI